jgi:hypothetical protein
MIDILSQTISTLVNDATLATLMSTTVPNKNIHSGRVDIIKEQQNTLGFPTIVLLPISENFSTVPLNAKQSTIQIDIWGRNSELEVLNIYERLMTLLNYKTGDNKGTHTFWQRSNSFTESLESGENLWRISSDIVLWSV